MPKTFQSKRIEQDNEDRPTSSPDVTEMESVYKSLERVEKPQRESLVSRPLSAGVIGLVAGVVGSLLVLGDLFGISSRLLGQDVLKTVSGGRTVVVERKERIDVPWEEVKTGVYEDIGKQMHAVYKKKKSSTKDELGTFYSPEESSGSAVGLTQDGWFVTVKNAMKEQKSQYVVSIGGNVYDMETVVPDSASDIVFFRVKAESVIPARFFSKTLDRGILAVVGRSHGSEFEGVLSGIASTNRRSTSVKNPFETSERLSSYFVIESSSQFVPGSGAFSLNGELMGLYDGTFGFIAYDRISSALPTVLKQKKVPLTIFGVSVLDLSTVNFASDDTKAPSFGYRIQSIQSNSPAQKAKLQVGDIILAIEQERVGQSLSLFERIQEYPSGTTVTLEVMRGTDTIKVPVALGGA